MLSLALGIGPNTAIFSLVHAVLFQDWGVGDPERLVDVYTLTRDGEHFFSRYGVYELVAEGTTDVFEGEGFGAASYVLDGWPVDFDDDRLDGILTGRVEMAFYEPDVAVIGGHMEIVNDEGAWNGVIRGAGVTDDDWRMLILLDGSAIMRVLYFCNTGSSMMSCSTVLAGSSQVL